MGYHSIVATILVLIGINLADKDDPAAVMVNSNDPRIKAKAYGYRRVQSGRRVELSSDRAAREDISFRSGGLMVYATGMPTFLDKDKVPTWSIKADKSQID